MPKTTFTYYADDGYVGKDRPLHVSVDDDELRECATEEEAYQLVAEAMEEAFAQRVLCSWDEGRVRAAIAEAREGTGS